MDTNNTLTGQNFRMPEVAKDTASMIAEGIWGKITGADYAAKAENTLLLIAELRKVRDANKPQPQRKLRTTDEALAQSIGKKLSELTAINIYLYDGSLSVNLSQLFKMASDPKHPVHAEALKAVLDRGIVLVEKASTRGKASLILAKGDFKAPVTDAPESSDEVDAEVKAA
jgi:hypothetical protein